MDKLTLDQMQEIISKLENAIDLWNDSDEDQQQEVVNIYNQHEDKGTNLHDEANYLDERLEEV